MLSIVIVTYNSASCLEACLRSLAGKGEVIVVDNASADGSAEVARRAGVQVLANGVNRGFAAAANQGVQAAADDLVLLLNPDTVLLEGLEMLEAGLRARPELSAAAGVLVEASGRPQLGFSVRRLPAFSTLACEVLGINRVWPGNPVNRRYRCRDLSLEQGQEVEQPAGACLLVRKEVWEQLGGMDEAFFPLWFEDVDFCLRLRQAGRRIALEPRCRFRHHGGHSLESLGFQERQLYWYRNLLYYVRKHWGSAAAVAMRALVFAGTCARMTADLLRGEVARVGTYRAVMRLVFSKSGEEPAP